MLLDEVLMVPESVVLLVILSKLFSLQMCLKMQEKH